MAGAASMAEPSNATTAASARVHFIDDIPCWVGEQRFATVDQRSTGTPVMVRRRSVRPSAAIGECLRGTDASKMCHLRMQDGGAAATHLLDATADRGRHLGGIADLLPVG